MVAIVIIAGGVFARGGHTQPQDENVEKKLIDYKFDIGGPVSPGDSVIFLVGNFAAQHNGCVITCDSAVRYSDRHFEFFGNVLINKNTTYIYGDRAEYDGDANEARIYSDLIKVVDGDATLYTYEFMFNTLSNVGEFNGGGVLQSRENLLESFRGYYYGDEKQLICVDNVEMRNEEYDMKGDSVIYNMENENAYFYTRTNIWNRDGDYLYADEGEYRKVDSLYVITRNGYVLTGEQEMWSDSIDYYRMEDHIILRNDIQMDDIQHKILAFGDYGEYWKTPGNAFLTREPSIISYDLSQGDSLFMRSDSMFLTTINSQEELTQQMLDSVVKNQVDDQAVADKLAEVKNKQDERKAQIEERRNMQERGNAPQDGGVDSLADGGLKMGRDSLAGADSLAMAKDTVEMTPKMLKAKKKAEEAHRKAREKQIKAEARKEKLAEVAEKRKAQNAKRLDEEKAREERRQKARRAKVEAKLRARRLKAERKGKKFELIAPEILRQCDSLVNVTCAREDSSIMALYDSLMIAQGQRANHDEEETASLDSMYRLVQGYRNVKIYRSDFQVVCDSMTSVSTDSTIHLHINPVLWNGNNQITSDVMDIYTQNQQIVRAEFIGTPIMGSQLDSIHYNQVAGKTMTSYFRDNEIYRNDVNSNARTIYYMQDGRPPVITMMGVLESGDISFFIHKKEMEKIVYRGNPVYSFYPMDQIPETQPLTLDGFKWQAERRPTQDSVFRRSIRPSQREERMSAVRPTFPIQERINADRQRFMDDGTWVDRNDVVDPVTEEWMHDLGFEVGQPRESGPKF